MNLGLRDWTCGHVPVTMEKRIFRSEAPADFTVSLWVTITFCDLCYLLLVQLWGDPYKVP